MPTVRDGHAAVAGADGRIYVIAGFDNNNANAQPTTGVQVFTPSTNAWTAAASMPAPLAYFGAVAGSDGRIYIMGGFNNYSTRQPVATALVYTPSTNLWTTISSLSTARNNLTAAAGEDGRIYAIGGWHFVSGSPAALATVEAYTPSTNTWATVASMPTARDGAPAVAGLDGRIYVVGGETEITTLGLTTVEAYTPGANSWASVAAMSTGRCNPAIALGADGRIYAIGGLSDDSNLNTGLGSVEAYTPSTNTWASVASMQTARGDAAAAVGVDRRIYLLGGDQAGSGQAISSVELYSP